MHEWLWCGVDNYKTYFLNSFNGDLLCKSHNVSQSLAYREIIYLYWIGVRDKYILFFLKIYNRIRIQPTSKTMHPTTHLMKY